VITPRPAITLAAVALYDYRGELIRESNLRREHARPTKTGARSWNYSSVARGITPERLGGIFARADTGDFRDLITLAAEIEERDAHAGAQLRTRKLAVAALPWKVEAASDAALDVEIAERFAAEVVGAAWWRRAVESAMDAVAKPFAALEVLWSAKSWAITDVVWRDQRHFQVDDADGATLRLRVDGHTDGEQLAAWKWVIHTTAGGALVKRGLVRPLAITYAIKTLGVGAWLTFTELFGIPTRIGKYAPGASEAEVDALEDAVRSIGADAAGVLPSSMEIDVLDPIGAGNRGDAHARLVEWAEAQQSKAILGQTMTADSGSSLSQAQVHEHVRDYILEADAVALAATFARDLLEPWVRVHYGAEVALPKLTCVTEDPEDRVAFTTATLPWVKAGLAVESSVIRDRLGLPEPAPGGEVVEVRQVPQASPQTMARRQASVITLAEGDEEDGDFIDRDGAPTDFGSTMAPLLEEVRRVAKGSESFERFLASLAASAADGDALVRSLATKTTIARGVGDATDDTEL